jgi:N-acetyl-alpha-D-muramate 1-phosphate uridylyltransferase
MKGVVFAAGLGTRLYPFTKDKPKALVEVQGRAMLGRVLDRMYSAGIREVVVNVHAFADKVEAYLHKYESTRPEMKLIVSDERGLLLETGGGLKKMEPFLDEPFLVHNVDVLTNFDLNRLKLDGLYLAVLAVRKTVSDRCFLFNSDGILCGWENIRTGERKISRPDETNLQRYGFTGIHLINHRLFSLMTEQGVFSITDVYLRLAGKHDIKMVDVGDSAWFDIGSPDQLAEAEKNYRE